MSKKEKKSKDGSKSRKYESDSDSSSSGSSASYSESYSSESEEERVPVKKPKLDSSSKKRQKKERKRQEKKRQKKTANKITKEDFFGKSVEFRLWLMEEKKISMEDIKTTKAKAYFKRFVKRWNSGKLPKKYYKGIDAADAKASLTKYKWKFAEKLQASGVGGPPSSSNSPFTAGGQPLQRATFSTFGKSSSPELSQKGLIGPEKPILGPQRPPHLVSAQYEEEEDPEAVKARLKAERKKFREDDKLVMEELAPKASGHEAKIEKKLLRRQRGHSPEVSDRVLMGSGMDIDTIMAKKRKSDAARRDRNTEIASVKLTAYQEKEKAKMQALLEMARATKSKDALW